MTSAPHPETNARSIAPEGRGRAQESFAQLRLVGRNGSQGRQPGFTVLILGDLK
jgi:hypothetical protein